MVALTTLLFGCDPTGDIGVAPLAPVGTFYTDTLTVRTSTVLADSVRTTSPDVYLMGRYVDPIFGTITASSFVQFSLEAAVNFDATAVYDSLVLQTPYNYTYGDTLPAQTISIHRLREQVVPLKNYYNDSKLAYDDVPLTTKSFLPRPVTDGGLLRFRLPDVLGKELFALSGKDAGKSNLEFAKILNGLALIPGDKNTTVMGFPAAGGALRLQLWFHTKSDTTAQGFRIPAVVTDTRTGNSVVRLGFNRVTADRKGTPLANLMPSMPLPSSSESAATYVQDALGVRTKIEIPYLKSLAKNGPIAINRAELSVKPVLTANGPGITIPPYLLLFETNQTNRLFYDANGFTSLVFNDLGNTPVSPAVPYDSRYQNYTWRIATQLNTILSGTKKNDAFLVSPVYTQALGQGGTRYQSQFNNRVSRLLLSTKKEDLKLIVFYTQARE